MTTSVKLLVKLIIQQNNEIKALTEEIESLKKEIESVRKVASIVCIETIVKSSK